MNTSAYKIAFCQFFTTLFDKMLIIAISWHIVSKSGIEFFSTFLAISLSPYLLSIFIAPAIIRKFGIINIVVFSDAFRSLLYIFATLAIFYKENFINDYMFLAISTITSIAASLFSPAIASLPFILVEKNYFQKFMSILQINSSISILLGAPLGIIAYNYLGIRGLFLFSAVIYGIAALIQKSIVLNKNPFEEKSPDTEHKTRHMVINFFVKYKLVSRAMLFYAASSILSAPLSLFVPAFILDIYHSDATGFSMLEFSMALGSIAGGLFLLKFKLNSFHPWKVVFFCNLISSALYLLFSLNTHLAVAGIILFIFSFFAVLEGVFIFKILQTMVNIVDIPFTISLSGFFGALAAPLGIYLGGIVTKLWNMQEAALLFAGLSIVLSLLFPIILRGYKSELSIINS